MTDYRLFVRVYFEDTDAGGIVYHARYLAFAERARTETMRAMGASPPQLLDEFGLFFVVHRAAMDYARPARLDDVIEVVTGPWQANAASVWVRQAFLVRGQRVGALRVRLACVRREDGRPARIPERWRLVLDGSCEGRPGRMEGVAGESGG